MTYIIYIIYTEGKLLGRRWITCRAEEMLWQTSSRHSAVTSVKGTWTHRSSLRWSARDSSSPPRQTCLVWSQLQVSSQHARFIYNKIKTSTPSHSRPWFVQKQLWLGGLQLLQDLSDSLSLLGLGGLGPCLVREAAGPRRRPAAPQRSSCCLFRRQYEY